MDTETIKKNNFPVPGMDFFGLRNSAIEYLQKLSGEEWTDFNEHDPGVTILDQLCYALTDLSYRTSYDIRDLLASKPEYNGRVKNPTDPSRDIARDSFFTVNEVMPCHPMTITDWRKLLIDKVENAKNVWIEPFENDHRHPSGLYRILVEVHTDVPESEHPEIIEKISKVFHQNRNLCEDLESIKILSQRVVKVVASVEIDEKMDSEETLAAIFFNLEKFLMNPLHMYTLPQMLEKGYTIETAFNGPRLDNGFILDEELTPRTTQIYYSRLIRVILEVPGVKNVYNFTIEGADESKKTFFLGEMEVPVFDIRPSKTTGEYSIRLLKNHIPVYIENNIVNSFYQAFKLGQPKPFVPGQHQQALRAFDVKLGRDRKAGVYRSVQYDFPPVYGIGEYGVGDTTSDKFISDEGLGGAGGRKRTSARRLGLARQLKGYLLVFDQMLANYLEQLASVPALFSINPDITRTYFPAMDLDVPGVEPLLKKSDGHVHVDGEVKVMQQAQLMMPGKFDYKEALDNIVTTQDQFFKRRNHFLDHLLARFSIFMPSRMFEDVNWYFTTGEELQQFILAAKSATLQFVDVITEKRGQAPVLHDPSALSWLELYLQLRLGMVDSTINLRMNFTEIAAPLYRYYVHLSDEPMLKDNRKRNIVSPFGKVTTEVAESDSFHPYDKPEKTSDHVMFRSIRFYRKLINREIHIDIDMFRNGYIANNYRFGYADESRKKLYVIYRDPEDNVAGDDRSWKVIGHFKAPDEAITAILGISSFIRYLNIETEGLHLVEHLPLRPSLDKLRFETQLLDESRKVLLQSDHPFSCVEDQEEIIKKILAAGCRPHSYVVKKETTRDRWWIELHDGDDKLIARSVTPFVKEKDAKLHVDIIMHRCVDLFIKDHTEGFCFRTLHPEGEIPILSFYSFRMTVAMPSWSGRFINPGFRQKISMLLRNYAPAHVSIGEFWMEPHEMLAFEKLYRQWRVAFAAKDPATESLAVKLGVLINQFYFSDSHY